MISSACLQPFLDSLSVSGVAITAISAMIPGFLVLVLRPFQPVKFVRKQTEIELEALERKLSTTLQASSSIIGQTHVFLDGTWKCVYFSPNCEKLFGYSAEEFVADDGLWMSRILPEDQEQVVLPVFKDILAGQVATMEFRFQHRDGSLHWISDTVNPQWDEAANCWVVTCVETDITAHKQAEAVTQATQERIKRDLKQAEAALRQGEAKNRAMISAIPDLLICLDGMGNYLEVIEGQNVRLLKPENGFDGRNIFDTLPLEMAERRMKYVRQALTTGQVQVYEQRIEVEGSFYDEEVRIAMIVEDEALVMVRDISDRKRIENERKQREIERERSQNLLRRQAEREYALNQMIQVIRHSLDLETIFLTATREIGQLLRVDQVSIAEYLPELGVWHHLSEYLRDPSFPSALNTSIPDQNNPIAAQLKLNQIVRIDNANPVMDSTNQELAQQFPGAWLLIPLEVEEKVWGCLTLLRINSQTLWQDADVDLVSAVADQLAIAIHQSQLYQRVQQLNIHLEQEVQQRTAQLRQALAFEALLKRITDKVRDSLDENQILQTAVDDLGQGLQVTCCNAALYDLTLTYHTITHEYSISQPFALGQEIAFADCPEIKVFEQLIQNICLQFCFTVTTYAQPHGEIYTILACPVMDDQGILGDLWLYRPKQDTFDESEIRLVQQVANQCAIALRQSRLYQAAQSQVQELERLNGLKDDFLSTVSHELRTPMANIKMATQMLEISMEEQQLVYTDGSGTLACTNTGDRIERYLQILKEECHRETRLINDLLDLSRLDSGSEPLLPLTHHLQYWLPHLTESFAERTHSQQQQFSITIDDQLPPLTTDFNYLEMILTELLHNACKYTPPGSAISVSATFDPATSDVILSIANSGVEIPATELQYVFDKFYRVPNNDPWKHGGTGLGLALVKKRVERLNGEIAVSSQNGWTTFTIELPLQV